MMTRFFFDIHDQDGEFHDEEGMELPDLEAAAAVGRKTLGGLVQDALRERGQDEVAITIRDGDLGSVVMRVTLETTLLGGSSLG
jgi:hypothetical protein